MPCRGTKDGWVIVECVQAKSLQSCPILCDPMDCSPPGSSVHGILQARILECVAKYSSGGSSQPKVEPTSLMSPALQVGSLPLASPGAKLQRIQRISLSSRVSTLSVWVLSNFSHVRLFVTLWTVACQAPLSVGFSRQEYWSGLPCRPPGNLRNPGTELLSLASLALAGWFFTTSATWEAPKRFFLSTLGVKSSLS